MKTKIISFLLSLLIVQAVYPQTEKPYLPTPQELAFPQEVAQKCFGLKKTQGSITQIEQGYGHVNYNKSFINQPICIGNKQYEHGIGVHAKSSLLVRLPKAANRFCAEVGLDNNSQTREGKAPFRLIFSIEAKGKVIWESSPVGLDNQALTVDIPLNGTTEFYMKVRSSGERIHLCHADWGNARVVYGKDEKVLLDEYAGKTSALNELPLSFVLNGQSSRNFLSTWKFSFTDSSTTDRIIHKIKWIKPDGTFEVRCMLIEYIHHPSVEWKLFFRNTGTKNSPVLEKVSPLDAAVNEPVRVFPNQSQYSPLIIHCNKGSNLSNLDFMPVTEILDLEQNYRIKSHAGRTSEPFLPFWNLEYHGSGLVTALGWSGDWKAYFSSVSETQAIMKAGMTNTNLFLKPGEEISSPSVCLLYWEGNDALRGNNLFRRYMRDIVVPKWNGNEPVTLAMSGGSSALETVNEKNQSDFIHKIAGTGAEIYWLDAGWYAGSEGAFWWNSRGNWFPDPIKFPKGMKILADEAYKNGLKFLLWFDPEVVSPGSDIFVKHPEWIIRKSNKEECLYNLGNQDALKHITDLISKNLIDWNVDIYRNDFNIDPGQYWEVADEPGRTGITEIRYVEGLYYFWDELLKRKTQPADRQLRQWWTPYRLRNM